QTHVFQIGHAANVRPRLLKVVPRHIRICTSSTWEILFPLRSPGLTKAPAFAALTPCQTTCSHCAANGASFSFRTPLPAFPAPVFSHLRHMPLVPGGGCAMRRAHRDLRTMTSTDDAASASLPATIHASLASALAARGYNQLTPGQVEMASGGHGEADLLASAQTGSGKTVAFGIAIASTLLGSDERFEAVGEPLGLVIAPTRELAIQVQREPDWLYAATGMMTASCVGGMDMRKERRALERGAHLVVGTPGRLRDHITRGGLDLSGLRAVVLDEADEMLDLGFREDLEFILGNAPQERRTLLFSATVPRGIAELARTFQRNAVRIATTAPTEQHADIVYELMLVRRD